MALENLRLFGIVFKSFRDSYKEISSYERKYFKIVRIREFFMTNIKEISINHPEYEDMATESFLLFRKYLKTLGICQSFRDSQ